MDSAIIIAVAFLGTIGGTLVLVELIRHVGGNHNGQPKS